jgi:hypothetical protein
VRSLLLALALLLIALPGCYGTVRKGDVVCREYHPSCPMGARQTCRVDKDGCEACTCECDSYDCGLQPR